jgi:hypothetical protein
VLTAEQRAHYESVRQIAQEEMDACDREIATELSRIKKRLLELQEDKKAVKQVFDGASARLGLELSPPLREINLSDFKKPVESPLFNSDLKKPVESQLFNSEASARLK